MATSSFREDYLGRGLVSPTSITHDWNVDGWGAFTAVNVSPSGTDAVALSVPTAGRGRVTGTGTGGNRRDVFLRAGTEWEDSEIRSLWVAPTGAKFPPNGAVLPQFGHIHRAVEVSAGVWRGVTVTNNIVGQAVNNTLVNVWEFNGATLTLGSNGATKNHETALRRDLVVTSIDRFQVGSWFNRYNCLPVGLLDLVATDEVDIVNMSDATFTQSNITPSSIDKINGVVVVVDPTDTTAVALKIATGQIVLPLYKRYWPRWVASRLVGTSLWVKSWRPTEQEPEWGSPDHVGTFLGGSTNNPAPNTSMPSGRGLSGLVTAHLADGVIEFGDVSFRRL